MPNDDEPVIHLRDLVGDFVTDPLDADLSVVSAFMVIKAAAPDGSITWVARSGGTKLSSEELLGSIVGYADSLLQYLAEAWEW